MAADLGAPAGVRRVRCVRDERGLWHYEDADTGAAIPAISFTATTYAGAMSNVGLLTTRDAGGRKHDERVIYVGYDDRYVDVDARLAARTRAASPPPPPEPEDDDDDDLAVRITKLSPRDGDIIVITGEDVDEEGVRAFQRHWAATNPDGPRILILYGTSDLDIAIPDDDQLARLGLMRIPREEKGHAVPS